MSDHQIRTYGPWFRKCSCGAMFFSPLPYICRNQATRHLGTEEALAGLAETAERMREQLDAPL
jgi:hypothetical protein